MGPVHDGRLVAKVVQFSFLLRLSSLLLVLVTPSEAANSAAGLLTIGFITLSSTAGLYATEQLTRAVLAHPILIVADLLVATTLAYLLGAQNPLLLYSLSTSVLIGILLPGRLAVLVLVVQVCATLLIAIEQDTGVASGELVVLPIALATLGAMGMLTRHLLRSAEREQTEARRLVADAAIERERARLARDMHDSVAKALHGIALSAAALPAWAAKGPDVLAERARELQQAAEDAARDARGILVDLRADTDDRTLAQQLRALADGLAAGGVETELAVGGIGDCDHAVKRELVAIAAEAIENVHRHAGAQHVGLSCTATPRDITIVIDDDGRGFDPTATPAGHFGLVGMRERAEFVGGSVDVLTAPGQGTTVTVRTPRTLEAGSA